MVREVESVAVEVGIGVIVTERVVVRVSAIMIVCAAVDMTVEVGAGVLVGTIVREGDKEGEINIVEDGIRTWV